MIKCNKCGFDRLPEDITPHGCIQCLGKPQRFMLDIAITCEVVGEFTESDLRSLRRAVSGELNSWSLDKQSSRFTIRPVTS